MKARYLVYSLGALAVLAAFWMLRTPVADAISLPAAATSASSTAGSGSTAVVPASLSKPAAPRQVAAPTVAPAAMPASLTTPAPVVDNQKELSTALTELIHYAQTGDLVTAWQMYAQPDHFAEIPLERRTQVDDHLRSAATNPQLQMRVQVLTQVLDSFTTQTPAYNDAGDVASFQVSGPATAAGLKTVHFQKVDGRWYLANDDLDNIGRLLGL